MYILYSITNICNFIKKTSFEIMKAFRRIVIKMIARMSDEECFCNATFALTSRCTRCTDAITEECNKEKRWESFDEGERNVVNHLTGETWPRKNVSRRKSGRYDETKQETFTHHRGNAQDTWMRSCAFMNMYRLYITHVWINSFSDIDLIENQIFFLIT